MNAPTRASWLGSYDSSPSTVIAIVAGAAIALIATETASRDAVYVMWAVLLVVTVALTAGTGPALAAALTSTIGDDLGTDGEITAARSVEGSGGVRHRGARGRVAGRR